jgi:hypothetical protein
MNKGNDDGNVESRGWGRDMFYEAADGEARAGSKRDFYGKETQRSKKAGEDDIYVGDRTEVLSLLCC